MGSISVSSLKQTGANIKKNRRIFLIFHFIELCYVIHKVKRCISVLFNLADYFNDVEGVI